VLAYFPVVTTANSHGESVSVFGDVLHNRLALIVGRGYVVGACGITAKAEKNMKRQYPIAGVCACPSWVVFEEMATKKWHSICFQMVSKPQTPITKLDKQGLNGEPRLAAGEAADDGGCDGEGD